MMNKQHIAVIGECMIELSQTAGSLQRSFGGDTLNTAVYLARQLDDSAFAVHYVTALGTDNFSQQMIDSWQAEQVHTDFVQRLAHRLPGLYYIENDASGERSFYYWRSEAAARFWLETGQASALCDKLAAFDYLYLSGISLAILSQDSRDKLFAVLRQCRARGGKVIFDNNYRPRLWANTACCQQAYQQMLNYTDMAFLTLDDEQALWGEQPPEQVIARTLDAGVEEIVIKRGASPCLVANASGTRLEVPAMVLNADNIVDTTAAGDAFSAGYLALRLTGADAQQAARGGHLLAGTVIQYRGAIIPRQAMPI